jgi:MATE family multidrug resistance protein
VRRSRYDTEILRLGLPALGALAADPLVSLVDTAFVGRLGAGSLGSLAVAAAVFGVAFGLFNFLAYGTTPLVARALGRGERDEAGRIAVAAGIVGVGLGVAAAAVLIPAARDILGLMGAGEDTIDGAATYLRIRSLALPAVMLVITGHGVFRGFQDTRAPLVVTLGLNAVNLVLDPILIFGFDQGLAGAAWATVVAQWIGAIWFVLLLARRRDRLGLSWALPTRRDVRLLLGAGRALVMRTGSLLAVLTLATAVAARIGTSAVAAHQVLFQIWFFLSLVLDALAIAGQAMIGKTLAHDAGEAAEISRRLLVLGLWFGSAISLVLLLVWPWLPGWFSNDPAVVDALHGVYPFLVVMQPLNALVFVWDGIVIGATDFSYLAWSMAGAAALSGGVLLAVLPTGWGLAGVWWAVVVLMLGRAATLGAWQLRGPLSASRGPSPSSPAA